MTIAKTKTNSTGSGRCSIKIYFLNELNVLNLL